MKQHIASLASCVHLSPRSHLPNSWQTEQLYSDLEDAGAPGLWKHRTGPHIISSSPRPVLQEDEVGTRADVPLRTTFSRMFSTEMTASPTVEPVFALGRRLYSTNLRWTVSNESQYNSTRDAPVILASVETGTKERLDILGDTFLVHDKQMPHLKPNTKQQFETELTPTESSLNKVAVVNISQTSVPGSDEIIEFRTRYIQFSPGTVTNIGVRENRRCRTCRTVNFVKTNEGNEPREIKTTTTHLYFPEPQTGTISVHDVSNERHALNGLNITKGSDTVAQYMPLTQPPDIVFEPSTRVFGASAIKGNTLVGSKVVSVRLDTSSSPSSTTTQTTTQSLVRSSSPSLFPEPKTYFQYEFSPATRGAELPASVVLESSLRSFPDVTLGCTEMQITMTASVGQVYSS